MDDDQPERAYSRVTTTERDAGAGRQAPAGWFPDPAGIHSRRYWDGQQWTTHVVDRNGDNADHFARVADQPPAGEPIVATVPEPDEATPGDERLLRLPGSARPAATVDLTDPELDSADEDSSQPDETYAAAAFATRVLERACDIGGVDCRNNAMTADEAIAALPSDLAEATVRVMHRTYAAAGDTRNADWALTKLDEIHARPVEEPGTEIVEEPAEEIVETPAEEPAELQSDAAEAAGASVTPMFSARARTEAPAAPAAAATTPDPQPAPQPTIAAGWYRDPGGRHQHRYWNGAEWTDRVADNSVPADDPLRWAPPGATSSTEAETRAASESLHGTQRLLARVRSLRKIWVLCTIVFTVLTIGYLLLPVNETATTVDGTRTVSLHCGSVISPESTATRGADITNASSICSAARHSNSSRVWFFGALALVSVVLASFARVSREDDDGPVNESWSQEPASLDAD